jgi:hypothetical protein
MLNELKFLKSPESFDPAYSRVLHHRIKVKQVTKTVCSSCVIENCNVTEFSNNQICANQAHFVNQKWAEPDLNRRPLARKANVLTKLDDRPTFFSSGSFGVVD